MVGNNFLANWNTSGGRMWMYVHISVRAWTQGAIWLEKNEENMTQVPTSGEFFHFSQVRILTTFLLFYVLVILSLSLSLCVSLYIYFHCSLEFAFIPKPEEGIQAFRYTLPCAMSTQKSLRSFAVLCWVLTWGLLF